jgi:rhamnosyltransferase subunit B
LEIASLHIIVSSWGSSGDVLPPIGIGWELKRRGYPVTFVGNPYFERQATEAGLAFVKVGTLADFEKVMDDADIFDRTKKTPDQLITEHILPYLDAYYETCVENLVPGQTVVVGSGFGAFFAAEKLNLPFVSVACSPGTSGFTSGYDPLFPERLLPEWAGWFARTGRRLALLYRINDLRHGVLWRRHTSPDPIPKGLLVDHPIADFRARVGLPKDVIHKPFTVCMWPDWFAAPQPDWPSETKIAGFPFYPRPDSPAGNSSNHLSEPQNSRPVVFTTGSIASSQADFFTAAVEACKTLKHPALLVTPHEEHIPRNLPDYISYLPFAPFNELFGRASLVVHHGGIGTASYALAAGIPQIAMPMRGDQFDNGNRLVRLGVASMLSPRQTTGVQLAQSISHMLNSDRVASRCEHWQSKIEVEAGLGNAANYIEEIARSSGIRS